MGDEMGFVFELIRMDGRGSKKGVDNSKVRKGDNANMNNLSNPISGGSRL